MKVGIYTNRLKDVDYAWTKTLHNLLESKGIEHVEIREDSDKNGIDLLIILGGDGTILKLVNFAIKADVPVIGINAGRLGFLTEFEIHELENAVDIISCGNYNFDNCPLLEVSVDNKTYYALNDVVFQRVYGHESYDKIVRLAVKIDNKNVDIIDGDGIIISTQKGSTAYSLSAGGAVLAPGIDAFMMTPICAHSLHNRSIAYPTSLDCTVTLFNNCSCGVFMDGMLIAKFDKDTSITVKKSSKYIKFITKKDSNFYDRLLEKLRK